MARVTGQLLGLASALTPTGEPGADQGTNTT